MKKMSLSQLAEQFLRSKKILQSPPNFGFPPERPVYAKIKEWNVFSKKLQKYHSKVKEREMKINLSKLAFEVAKEEIGKGIASNVWIITECEKYAVGWVEINNKFDLKGNTPFGYKQIFVRINPKLENLPVLDHLLLL